jgi:anaerobic dimethyl sulfoxide reductase subunit B (iron-sulfur subunit)
MTGQLAFYFEQEHCVGCLTCQIACKDKKDLEVGQLFRKVHESAGGGYRQKGRVISHNVFAFWLSMSCNHCQAPACMKNCPTGAIRKRPEDGIVFIDEGICIGCQNCVVSCPYGAPQYNPQKGKAGKCDLCRDQLAAGKQPACVAACPMRALHYGRLDVLRQKYGSLNRVPGMPDPDITRPSLVITPHRDSAGKK